MNLPFSYTDINLIAGRNKPSTQKYNSETAAYWARALFERAAYAIELTLPAEWETDLKGLFYYWLYSRGFIGIYNEPEMGLVFQPGTIGAQLDFYYRPTRFIVTNPYAPDGQSSRELVVNKDVAIVKLSPDYQGIWDIIQFYSEKLAQISLSIDMSIINTRFAKIMGARNKAAAETLKKILDKINSGQPAVITDDKLLDDRTDKASPFQEFGIDHLKENYITDLQLRDLQTILSAFDNEIGIPTVPYQKKERMVTYEAQSREIESIARATVWVETLNSCFKVVNDMFGTNMKAAIRERGSGNGDSELVNLSAV